MKLSRKNIVLGIIITIALCFGVYIIYQKKFYLPLQVTVDAKISSLDTYQVFYDTGNDFNEKESVRISVFPSDSIQSIVFTIPTQAVINRLRIDFGDTSKSVEIKNITLSTKNKTVTFTPQDILEQFPSTVDISSQNVQGDLLYLKLSERDSQLASHDDILKQINLHDVTKKILFSLIVILLFLFTATIVILFNESIFNLLRSMNLVHNSNFRLTIIFIGILFIPMTQMIFDYLPELTLEEKRVLAPAPDPTLLTHTRTWDDYTQSFETFFNDHYGLRSLLIYSNSLITIKVFGSSPTPDIIIGKNGWLFYDSKTDGVSFKDYYGKALFSEGELETIATNILDLQNKLKKQGAQLIIVLAPNKQSVYGEYLPTAILNAKGLLTRADQLDILAKKHNLPFVDLRPALNEAKLRYDYPLYFETDTHWNELGAFIGFNEIMKTITHYGYRTHPRVIPTPLPITTSLKMKLGDLGQILNFINYPTLTSIDLNLKGSYLTEDYSDMTNKQGGLVVTKLPNQSFPKIIVFRDSFFTPMIQFFSESFSNAIYMWQRNIDYSIINKEKPDIVIVEFNERAAEMLLQLGR